MSKKIFLAFFILVFTISCNAIKPKKLDTSKTPHSGAARARQNVDSGGGVSLKGILKGGRGTNFEFSSSNPLWRASLEVLDFMPMTTVDYSGGIIITDWYSDSSNPEDSIKITVRFLSNEVQSNSVKIIVHNKKCRIDENCTIREIDSKIKFELQRSILAKAAQIELDTKKSKK